MYLMMAAVGLNFQYMQTHGVFIPRLYWLNNNKSYLTICHFTVKCLLKMNCVLMKNVAWIFIVKESARQEASMKQVHISFVLGLSLNPENGGIMFLWNVGWLAVKYTALYPRRYNSSYVKTVCTVVRIAPNHSCCLCYFLFSVIA